MVIPDTYSRTKDDADLRLKAEEIKASADVLGIDIVIWEDPRFPKRFKGIRDMPILLYVKGKLIINDFNSSIGVVGARRCSAWGKEKAIEVSLDVVNKGDAVISGMVKGIDSYAHTAALKNGGYTIAVLGSGVDISEVLFSEAKSTDRSSFRQAFMSLMQGE